MGLIPLDRKINVYSTEEIKTTKIWIDGKPIYRKTFTIYNQGSSDINRNIETGLNNLDMIKFDLSNCFVKQGSGYVTPPNYEADNNYFSVYIDPYKKPYIKASANQAGNSTFYITIEYTKTTD